MKTRHQRSDTITGECLFDTWSYSRNRCCVTGNGMAVDLCWNHVDVVDVALITLSRQLSTVAMDGFKVSPQISPFQIPQVLRLAHSSSSTSAMDDQLNTTGAVDHMDVSFAISIMFAILLLLQLAPHRRSFIHLFTHGDSDQRDITSATELADDLLPPVASDQFLFPSIPRSLLPNSATPTSTLTQPNLYADPKVLSRCSIGKMKESLWFSTFQST